MPLLADRVRETSATTGTGTLTLAGAVAGYQGFNAAFANADTVYYVIQYATEWEVGIGTVGTGTLSRDSVLASSNADALVPFSAGTKDVFVAYVAERAVTTSDAATLTNKTIDDITNLVGADHIHYKIKANATITKGQTLKAVGYNAGQAAIEVEPISSASDIAVGIAYQDLASGAFGAAINTGLLIGVKTDFAGWALGDVLYPDPSTGGLTKTKPTSGTYQACAYIMRVQSNNGVLLCEFTEPQQVLASTATANTAVLRDGSGNFAAGTVTAALTGNASTATALATARNINGVSFNGTADITVTAAAGTLSGATLAAGVTASSLTSVGTLGSLTVTNPITGSVTGSSGSTTGNAATATTLQTARNINGVSFNGSADITVTAAAGTLSGSTLASGVTASSLTSVGTLTSLGVSGNLTVDTNTLFVDATNNRVGVGTASPSHDLHVIGSTNGRIQVEGSSGFGMVFVQASSGQSAQLQLNSNGGSGKRYLIGSNASGSLVFSDETAATERARIDTSGNLGLGVTPSAWTIRALQLAAVSGSFSASQGGQGLWGVNAFFDGAWKYGGNAAATYYEQSGGVHSWYTAASGTAGNAISFTQMGTLTSTGLGLGASATSPGQLLTLRPASGNFYTSFVGDASATMGLLFGTSGNTVDGQVIYSNSTQVMSFVTSSAERARITAGGDVGIGETNPTGIGSSYRNLVLKGTSGSNIDLNDATGTVRATISTDSSGGNALFIDTRTSHPIVFRPNTAERLRVDNTATAGNTALLLYDVDNGTMERVTVGAADSAGTGFKVLRIPN